MHSKPHMTVEDLVLFYHVVEKGGFLRAAEALNFNQGRASRSIARLEEAYGTTLLYRDMRNIKLTRTGKIVFDMARDMLERMNQGHLDVQAECKDMVGPITLWATNGFGNYWLIPQLIPFLKQHPDIEFNLKTEENQINLMMGNADIAIVTVKPDFRDALECHLLCEYPLHIYASEDYLVQHGTPRCVEDLDQHQMIAWRDNIHESVASDLFNTLLYIGRDGRLPRKASIYLENDLNMITCASKGLGLVFMPSFFAESIPLLKRVYLENEENLFKNRHQKYIVYHRSLNESARHQIMIDFIRTQAQSFI